VRTGAITPHTHAVPSAVLHGSCALMAAMGQSRTGGALSGNDNN
jgi:hypothetical protein